MGVDSCFGCVVTTCWNIDTYLKASRKQEGELRGTKPLPRAHTTLVTSLSLITPHLWTVQLPSNNLSRWWCLLTHDPWEFPTQTLVLSVQEKVESHVSATVLTREKEWRHKFILKNCMKYFNWKRACIFTYIHLFIFCIPTPSNTCPCRVKALIGVWLSSPELWASFTQVALKSVSSGIYFCYQ